MSTILTENTLSTQERLRKLIELDEKIGLARLERSPEDRQDLDLLRRKVREEIRELNNS